MGPRTGVVPFFESMGFRCPERKAVPDFLQEVNSIKDQAVRDSSCPVDLFWHRQAVICSVHYKKDHIALGIWLSPGN